MLELLVLLPFFMVGLLSMTFQISLDEVTDVSRKTVFNYGKYEEDYYRDVLNKVHNPAKCQCECQKTEDKKIFEGEKTELDECNYPKDSPKICPHGYYFDSGYCRCIPINGEYRKPGTQRRPPV